MGHYVLHTHSKAEESVQDRITKLGAPSLLLRRRRITRSHHRGVSPFTPVLPGYLFVQLDLPSDMDLVGIIKRYPGVLSWLGSSPAREAPLAVRPIDFTRLEEIAAELEQDVTIQSTPTVPLAKDTVVRVLWGAMPGAVGTIQFDNGIRADVLLQQAGLATKISLPRELIEAA